MKKTICCFVVLVLISNSGAFANRSLKNTVTTASASATVKNGGSAKSVAVSKGSGANSKTHTEASNGANVKAKTVAASTGGAKVNAKTAAVGHGPGADSTTITIVSSDKDVDVGRYIARVSNGANIVTLANELVVEFGKRPANKVVDGFKKGLAHKDRGFNLFYKALELFVNKRGCDSCKKIFKGQELGFIQYKLPQNFYKCVFNRCADYGSSFGCCSDVQMKLNQCSCFNGKCLWRQPASQGPFLKYWKCQNCGEKVPYCACY